MPIPTLTTEEAQKQAADKLLYPPLAKSLIPAGVRVISVQGIPPATTEQNNLTNTTTSSAGSASSASPSTYADYSQPKILILMVPLTQIEPLALSLQEGDLVVVSLMAQGSTSPSAGFTYWDLEQLIRSDREKLLNNNK
jgi:hypothetical protein